MTVTMLEYAVQKSPANSNIRYWLMKILHKMGLSSRFTAFGQNIKGLTDVNFENFGAFKYTHYQAYGIEKELDQTC